MTTEQQPPPSTGAEAERAPEDSPATSTLTVVGIGASAGGLAALQGFLAALPHDSGLTFVVVVHLSPDHESALAELLQRVTPLPVTQVTARVQMQPNYVYVIPPGRRLLVSGDALDVAEINTPEGRRRQIDLFFRSLAEVQVDGAVLILSGTGSDGAVGIQAIKERGGLVLVQAPAEAEFDAMPLSAIATGLVDIVAPVAELAQRLVAIKQMNAMVPLASEDDALALSTLTQILFQVQAQTGHSFQGYKRVTLLRRIARRQQITGQPTLSGYLNLLRQHNGEADLLFRELLIHVTRFFRDPEAWTVLAETVIPPLFAPKNAGDAVRVWVAGCATGEEAYTLTILLLEEAARRQFTGEIQVFASDLSRTALDYARVAYYPEAIAADVTEARLARFFVKDDSHYQVRHEVRERVLFTQHNLLQDPAFSKLDLISCRNLLIYLQREVQTRVMSTFDYALHPHGYLFLGNAETVDGMAERFQLLDKRQHIYQRRDHHHLLRPLPGLPLSSVPLVPPIPTTVRRDTPVAPPHPTGQAARHGQILETLGPPSLLVDAQAHILHLSETVGRYLLQPGGTFTRNVIDMVRPELQGALRAALYEAVEQARTIRTRSVPVRFNGTAHPVSLWVRPVAGSEGQVLVAFLEETPEEAEAAAAGATGLPDDPENRANTIALREMIAELGYHQQQLLALRETQAATVEELRAANEELQSTNEEYKAALEELETSKEELQSTNEELQLVNQELRNKVEEVSQTHNDQQNLLLATNIATLFLDRDLRVKRFTPAAALLFNLLPLDQDRPIMQLRPQLDYPQLEADARQVLAQLVPVTREIQADDARCFLVEVRPYRTRADKIEGVVVTFVDITARRQVEEELRVSKKQLEEAQMQLVQQERLAAVGGFAAGVAHDFNNILAIIVLNVELGLHTPHLHPKLHKQLETIAHQMQRATQLVQQILDFGRRAVMEAHILDLVPFLQELLELLQRSLPANIKIHLSYGDKYEGKYIVKADATRLQQIITNLVINARDAMPDGGKLGIDLERFRVETPDHAPLPGMEVGEWLQLSVRDTGDGIAPEVLPHLFEPFFTTKNLGKGTGLGLSQVYGIVKQHHGHIDVQTQVGKGTTFIIYLPAHVEQNAAPGL